MINCIFKTKCCLYNWFRLTFSHNYTPTDDPVVLIETNKFLMFNHLGLAYSRCPLLSGFSPLFLSVSSHSCLALVFILSRKWSLHSFRGSPLPIFRWPTLQLPGPLQVSSRGRLQYQRLPGQSTQWWPQHQIVLLDQDGLPDPREALDHATTGLRRPRQQGNDHGSIQRRFGV